LILDTIHLNTIQIDGLSDFTLMLFQSVLDFFDNTKVSIIITISKVIVCIEGEQEAIE
jgi:hypothetical protein